MPGLLEVRPGQRLLKNTAQVWQLALLGPAVQGGQGVTVQARQEVELTRFRVAKVKQL